MTNGLAYEKAFDTSLIPITTWGCTVAFEIILNQSMIGVAAEEQASDYCF